MRVSEDTARRGARTDSANTLKPFDFSGLVDGTHRRPEAKYCKRSDGVALIYPGREHSVYGETECGKDMLLVYVTKQITKARGSVVILDFEEGDGTEFGSRLLNAGMAPELLCDFHSFAYYTPSTEGHAEGIVRKMAEADPAPDLVVFNGVTAAYGVFGWQVKENDDATTFRRTLVRPLIGAGTATLATDHVTKSGNESRYAIGGVMKLNLVNGAAYLMENVDPIVRGSTGYSTLTLTKDRPGTIKPHCQKGEIINTMNAAILTVKSRNDSRGGLRISLDSPIGVSAKVQRTVLALWESISLSGADRLNTAGAHAAIGGDENTKAGRLSAAVNAGLVLKDTEGRGKPTWYSITDKGREVISADPL
jgi:hypothetical protein